MDGMHEIRHGRQAGGGSPGKVGTKTVGVHQVGMAVSKQSGQPAQPHRCEYSAHVQNAYRYGGKFERFGKRPAAQCDNRHVEPVAVQARGDVADPASRTRRVKIGNYLTYAYF